MDDGVDLAATLYEPSNAPPPGRLPGDRALPRDRREAAGPRPRRPELRPTTSQCSPSTRAATASRAGSSRSTARARSPTRARSTTSSPRAPEIDKTRIGAWGISLGGGAVLRSLVEGVPWAAVETGRDLDRPLQRARPAEPDQVGRDLPVPELGAGRSARSVRARRSATTRSRAATSPRCAPGRTVRSSRKLLKTVKTPVFMFQGRRDFAFDIAQAKAGYALLKGPKRLYVGDFGHSPSTFPGPDFAQMMQLGMALVHALPRYGDPTTIAPITLAPSPWRGKLRTFATLPPTRRLIDRAAGERPPRGRGPRERTSGPLHRQRRDLRLGDRAADRAPDRRLVAPGRRADRRAAQGLRDRRQRGRHQHDRPHRQRAS